jgi:deoxyribose-phosphate aldolase
MALRLEDLAKTLDHALLEPEATPADLERVCAEAREHHLASVCVLPQFVAEAVEHLRGCDVKVCAVIGCPLGDEPSRAKIAVAERCAADGAGEVEVVVNVGAMVAGEFLDVRDELAALVHSVRMTSVNSGKGQVLVKIALETSHLDEKRIRLAGRIIASAGADFAANSTGRDGGAPRADVELLRECLPEAVAVKASGRIETLADVQSMVDAGAARVGTARAAAIMNEAREPV